jgi:hypothetical protein
MKKFIFPLAVITLTLVSCKKDYSCTCTETDVYNGETDVSTYSYKVEGATKKQAQAACNEATIIETDGSDSYTVKCDLTK